MRSIPGNPYEALTLEQDTEHSSILAEGSTKTMILDRSDKGAERQGIRILRLVANALRQQNPCTL